MMASMAGGHAGRARQGGREKERRSAMGECVVLSDVRGLAVFCVGVLYVRLITLCVRHQLSMMCVGVNTGGARGHGGDHN